MKRNDIVSFIIGTTPVLRAAVRIVHARKGTVTVEPCCGKYMGMLLTLPILELVTRDYSRIKALAEKHK